ncbi:Asp-tRNA(Asn)/Glu-tRNA(Gln) amidotransferase subunit GatA [Hahella sp. KA22]|uniref:Asp-tRNA(Asn)/Glu-tRNA(Gln) amidotransferase subunit GatA n=1 Tax=Hahella sp. KA22 TaxID=1628392 RepID=UPI000FDE2B68|nr:Asp-tRNA(Asn)/Glu-tRNA(Gln) amidotransferase subunit GatA [Hahella sp. KA22]AZZ90840.1 Asp-tRNA(Asn)/Glu-tRNA(Gln) amidotransferase subunit GatA [Hahella sp. KA22]QAY54210.1 Asp-tRNA(Asn)/Glu-tRNA(Gln) amidotransferase subunit GatA [Hahella sp. KA22]
MLPHTISEIISGLRDKQFSSREITQDYLTRIKRLNPELNCFITITEDLALSQAEQADARLNAGEASILNGVPLAHKDVFCTEGVTTTCGSRMLERFVPPYESTVTRKFMEAGAVTLGKTNMDEFAMGSSNENSYFGPVRNPWDTERAPGGSSGGSAAAVAAGLCAAATGTDTGGSIRQPAAFCGLTGLKPTYGRVSRLGMVAFASSLDQGGPFARTAEDTALLMNVMAGHDPMDSTSALNPTEDYTSALAQPLTGVTIGLPKEYFSSQLNAELEKALQEAIKVYESLGASFKEVSLPHTELSVPAYYVIAPAECSTNLSRFDGVRYGHRCENPKNLEDLYQRSRSEGFGDEVKRRILIGTYALSAGYYDAYYRQAQKIRRLIKNDFVSALNEVDALLCPTTPDVAFKLGEKTSDPVQMYLEDIFTIPASLAGLPALGLPCGFKGGLPVGMQLIGNYFTESRLLNLGHQYQLNTDWHKRSPALGE